MGQRSGEFCDQVRLQAEHHPSRAVCEHDEPVTRPDPGLGQRRHRVALTAAGDLRLEVETTPVGGALAIAEQVASGRSRGVKHVLEF